MKTGEILAVLEGFAPYDLAESWDNVGLLAGDRERRVTKVLCALDITEAVVDEAIGLGANLIVAHHPVVFTSVRGVTADTVTGTLLIKLIKADISAICMHTNADCADGGVNDLLAAVLGLKDVKTLGAGDHGDLGRVGNLSAPMPLEQFVAEVREKLHAGGVRYTAGSQTARRVAVLGGAGGKLLEYAIASGADTFVTGDCSYDRMQLAQARGLNLIDAGHFPTEHPIAEGFARLLREKTDVEVLVSCHQDCIRFL